MKLFIYLNDDLERVLRNISKKRKKTISEVVNIVLLDWLETKDFEQYDKSTSKKGRMTRNATM